MVTLRPIRGSTVVEVVFAIAIETPPRLRHGEADATGRASAGGWLQVVDLVILAGSVRAGHAAAAAASYRPMDCPAVAQRFAGLHGIFGGPQFSRIRPRRPRFATGQWIGRVG
ncbi:MAG TPA: hypothetical protein VF192_07115 [Longimicrobiales bacterium]